MASVIYPLAKQAMLKGDLDMDGTVKAALIDTDDVAYSAAHDNYDDVSAAVVGTPQEITTKTFTNGQFNGDDVTFSSVSGDQCEAIIIYIDTGTPSTSQLIAFIDSATGLPVTPSGGDITITWDTYIFAL